LSTALEKLIAECLIDLVPNDKALVPSEHAHVGPDEWDGSFGLQKGMKTVKLASGKEVKADFVFIGIGNRSNVELVEEADDSALADGQIWVDDYLRVCVVINNRY
jgi:NADPH-dependent 2,4-dienoyl-CoA reductase/sulfur reductase-like enzyme